MTSAQIAQAAARAQYALDCGHWVEAREEATALRAFMDKATRIDMDLIIEAARVVSTIDRALA